MKITTLKKTVVAKAMKKLPLWSLNQKGSSLTLVQTFKNHIDALVFIARITVHAQVMDHHPEIVYTYKKVKVTLTTHEVKGITKKDIELAEKIRDLKSGG